MKVAKQEYLDIIIKINENIIAAYKEFSEKREELFYKDLYQLLNDNFKEFEEEYESSYFQNYPVEGVSISAGYRINFDFKDEAFFLFFKSNYGGLVRENISVWERKFFWNYNRMNIYPKNIFHNKLDDQGVKKVKQDLLDLIIKISENIVIPHEKFSQLPKSQKSIKKRNRRFRKWY